MKKNIWYYLEETLFMHFKEIQEEIFKMQYNSGFHTFYIQIYFHESVYIYHN